MGHARKVQSVMLVFIVQAIATFFCCIDKASAQTDESRGINAAIAIERLSSRQFESRQAAFDQLVQGGSTAIAALEQAARTGDVEVGTRCVAALVQIARQKNSFAAAVAALERLAADDSNRFAGLAADAVEELTMSDEERARRALRDLGSDVFFADGKVYGVTLTRNREVKWLQYLPTLQSINLRGPEVTDACIDALLRVKTELSLALFETNLSDRALRRFDEFQNLKSLSFAGKLSPRVNLSRLGRIATLKSLSLNLPVDESMIKDLANLKQIEILSLSEVQVSPVLVESLNQLDQLELFMLHVDDLTDDQCGDLAKVKTLFHLSVFRSKHLTPAGWKSITDAPIQSLSVSGSSVSDLTLAHLGSISELKYLSISDAPVTNEGLKHLERLTSLRSLRLTNTEVSDEGIDSLRGELPDLRNVSVRTKAPRRRKIAPGPAFRQRENRITGRTDVHMHTSLTGKIAADLKELPNLGTISLVTYSATDEQLECLADVPVRGIRVRSNKITDRGIAALKDHTSLEFLLIGSKQVTDDCLDSVLAMPSLRRIEIRDTPLSDDGVRQLVEKLEKQKRITRLRLFDCPNVTEETVSRISEFNLSMLDLHPQQVPLGLRKIGEPLARPR